MTETINLAYRAYGAVTSKRQTVVLLHPFPFDGRMWQQVAPTLAQAGWHVIVPDLRGCGSSVQANAEPDMSVLAHDVWSLLDNLGIVEPLVLGISLGGYVTMAMLRVRPGGLSGIGLIDTKATADRPDAQLQRRAVAHHMRTEADVQAFAEVMVSRCISETSLVTKPEVATEIHGWILEAAPLTIAWLQEAMADRPDSAADLQRFAGPALLLRGSEDVVCSEEDYAIMRSALPSATYLTLQGCGHLPPVEDAQATSAAILEWLSLL